jgi:uncharacterized membrane protein
MVHGYASIHESPRGNRSREKEQKKADLFGNVVMAGFWLLVLVVILVAIFALTKFVKWAWYS